MDRRAFLGALGALGALGVLAATPVLAKLPALPLSQPIDNGNPLFSGSLGHWDGVRIHKGNIKAAPEAAVVFSAALMREMQKTARLRAIQPVDGNYYWMVIPASDADSLKGGAI